MKSVLLLALTACTSVTVLAESAIPSPFTKDRYQETVLHSPFALATPPQEKAEVKDGPLANLWVTGMGKLDDGQPYILVQRLGDDRSMKFIGNSPNEQGISVKQVKWGDRWNQTKVVLRHQSDEAEVEFKRDAPPIAAVTPPGQQNGPRNGQRGPAPGVNAPNNSIIPPGLNGAPAGGVQKQPSITPTMPRMTNNAGRAPGGVPLPSNNSFRGSANLSTAVPPPANSPQPNGAAPRVRVRTINNR